MLQLTVDVKGLFTYIYWRMDGTKKCGKCKEYLPLSMFCGYSRSKDGIDYYCKTCRRAYSKKSSPAKIKKYIARMEAYVDNECGNVCMVCMEHCPSEVMHFHHIDRRTKTMRLNQGAFTNKNFASGRLAKEIAKCVCLCPRCHSLHHCGYITVTSKQDYIINPVRQKASYGVLKHPTCDTQPKMEAQKI